MRQLHHRKTDRRTENIITGSSIVKHNTSHTLHHILNTFQVSGTKLKIAL